MVCLSGLLALCAAAGFAHAHLKITYPGWRGESLVTNGTIEEGNGLGIYSVNGTLAYPYGMEWAYPCRMFGRAIASHWTHRC